MTQQPLFHDTPEPLDPVAEEGRAVAAVEAASEALTQAVNALERARDLRDTMSGRDA